MKAVFLTNTNEPLIIKEVPKPIPGEHEVLVKLQYSSLNHRDVWILKGQYSGAKSGLILGSDGYGIVEEVGQNADQLLIGKGVIINPSHNWGNNPAAASKDFKILGNPDPGTFSEYIVADQKYVHLKPNHLTEVEAAALPLAGITTFRAVFTRAKVEAGEKVLVTGIGAGTALLALQFAKAAGADVYVTSGSDEKIEKAMKLGAIGGYNYKDAEWYKKAKKDVGGFDVILDSASGSGFGNLIQLANPGARLTFWGGTDGAIGNIVPAHIFWKNVSILGTTMGSEEDFKGMLACIEGHNIKPIVAKIYPSMDKIQDAFSYLEAGKQFGKIVIANTF